MKWKVIFGAFAVLLIIAGCAPKSHFGVPNKALTAPDAFEQTEAVIAEAEASEGAKYCPERIAEARELGREAALAYWACRTGEAMGMLGRARDLAKSAESCQPPPPPAPAPAPAPAPQPPPLPTSLPSGNFEFDQYSLTPGTMSVLDGIAVFMRDNPRVKVEIQGHTDSVGTEDYNQALGMRRAEAVFDYLTSKGVSTDRLQTVSFGETRPVAPNDTAEGRAQNRRVDLIPMK